MVHPLSFAQHHRRDLLGCHHQGILRVPDMWPTRCQRHLLWTHHMLWIRERSCISLLFKLLRMEHGVVLQGIAIEVLHLLVSQHSLVDDVSYWPTLPSKLLTREEYALELGSIPMS